MSVLARHELQQSPLADLHALAAELGIESFRGMRRDDLVEAIFEAQGGEPETPVTGAEAGEPAGFETANELFEEEDQPAAAAPAKAEPEEEEAPAEAPAADESRARRGRGRGRDRERRDRDRDRDRGRGRGRDSGRDADRDREREDEREPEGEPEGDEEVRTGILDVLPNGSGFMRANAYAHSRDDVYVSPAQIRRCELRAGDEISGSVRPPRRSERYPSLIRVDSVNGREAEPPEERPEFEKLTPIFPAERLPVPARLSSTPFGKGSRVSLAGPPGAGATTLLREIVASLSGTGLELTVVLAGVRPEEVTEWRREAEGVAIAGGAFDHPPDELAQVAAMAMERAKRVAERGGDACVVVDGLDALPPGAGRRIFSAARNLEDAGSITVIASIGTAGELQRIATTRVVLEPGGRIALASGTLRAEQLA